jgi:putative protein-disulfide isomerase
MMAGSASETASRAETRRQILYFADPMCSWCWGFSPVLARILATYGARVPVRLVAGGLRAGATAVMGDKAKTVIRGHWEHVQAATGQPFDFAFFERSGFVYDTEPACRAVVAMRNLAPEQTFAFLAAVQRAFYVDGLDVTDAATLAALAEPFCGDADVFAAVYGAEEIAEATRADFRLTQVLGIAGFPAVVLKDPSGLSLLTVGYRPFAELAPALDAWLGD